MSLHTILHRLFSLDPLWLILSSSLAIQNAHHFHQHQHLLFLNKIHENHCVIHIYRQNLIIGFFMGIFYIIKRRKNNNMLQSCSYTFWKLYSKNQIRCICPLYGIPLGMKSSVEMNDNGEKSACR